MSINRNAVVIVVLAALFSTVRAEDPTLDSILKRTQVKEAEQRNREQAIRELKQEKLRKEKEEKEAQKKQFESDYGKYEEIVRSSQATQADKQAAWKVLCKTWFPGFEDCTSVSLVWVDGRVKPTTLGGLISLLADIDITDRNNAVSKEQIEKSFSAHDSYDAAGFDFRIYGYNFREKQVNFSFQRYYRYGDEVEAAYNAAIRVTSAFGRSEVTSTAHTAGNLPMTVYERRRVTVNGKALRTIELVHLHISGGDPTRIAGIDLNY